MSREIALSLAAAAVSLVVLRPTAAVTIDDGYAEDNGRTSEFFTNFTVLSPDTQPIDAGPSLAEREHAAPNGVFDFIRFHDVADLGPEDPDTVAFDFTDPVIARAVDPNTGLEVTRAYETGASWPRSVRAVPASTELDTPTPPSDPEVPGHSGSEAALEDTAALGNVVPLPAPAVLLLIAVGLAVPRVLRAR